MKGSYDMNYVFSDRIAGMKPSAIREILKNTADPSIIPFAAGNPAPEAFPVEAVRRITGEILTERPIAALQYSITEGYPALKDRVRSLASEISAIGPEDELMITSGAQQGIELACKVLCNEGDIVLCEDPSFIGSLNSFRSTGAKLVGIPMEEDGMSMEALSDALEHYKNVRLLYVIPNFQNPSGRTTSAEKRRAIYALAKKHGIMILEDDPYGRLRFAGEDIAPIKSLDEDGLVIYCGSFSKILSPGLRVGYVIARPPVIGKITVAKQCEDVHTSILSQMIAERFLAETDMAAHFEKLRGIYRHKSALMLSTMEEHFDHRIEWTKPEGGLFLWCTLPEGTDMPAFCKKAIAKSVAVVPGIAFNPDEDAPSRCFRMNYSTPTDEQIVRGVEILGKIDF